MGASMRAWSADARRELHRVASEPAFHRCRVLRGFTLRAEADALRAADYLRRLSELYDHGHTN